MRSYIIFVCLTIPWANGQRGRSGRQHHNSHGWDIRLAVPGEPGNDYPVLNTIPRTSFSCAKKTAGYYADIETNCQVFRVCTLGSTYSFQSFLCPNGTLFNQAVFVCDWWMNVKCTKSAEYFNNNDKYGNLRIGPQLMIDVKNMLTHSMRNPYNNIVMKNKNVVMQEYKPPSGQPQTNEGYYVKAEQEFDNYFINSKQVQKTTDTFNSHDSFVASTSNPRYISTFNAFPPSATKLIQGYQTQNDQDLHNIKWQDSRNPQTNSFTNGHLVRVPHNIQMPINTNAQQIQQTQYLTPSNQRFRIQDLNPRNQLLGINKQEKYQYVSKQTPNQNYQNNYLQAYSPIGIQTKQNSVSIDVPSTIVTRTLTYRRTIENPKQGQPKSRITFKKWIVKPTRSARLAADPTPYTYNIPSPQAENIIAENSYYYNKPTTDNTVIEKSYIYSKPTTNKSFQNILPTAPINQVTDFNENLIATSPTPTLSSRLYLAPISTIQTNPALLYLPPTTYKPASFIYIPPTENSKLILHQDVSENSARRTSNYENIQSDVPLYSLTKQSHVNAKRKNLTFSDILTKEKLDITVNDIVKDTDKIIKTASLKQDVNIKQDIREPDNYYIPAETDSEEIATNSPITLSRNSKLIASPSVVLEAPKEEFFQSSNRISNLPFFKEPAFPTNTIERTVSLKITIPEKVADLLFKNQSVAQSDNLELLNTGSSNYLVLNKKKTNEAGNNIIPIVKLSWTDNSNLSNPQDLVYSFLADSINSAKQYKNIVQQELSKSNSSTLPTQSNNFQKIEQLTSQISDLTSMQYSSSNLTSTRQTSLANKQQSKDTKSYTQQKQQRLTQPRKNQLPDSEVENLQIHSNNIYSGQLYKLPVPLVTQKIYNAPLHNNLNQPSQAHFRKENSLYNKNNVNEIYKEKKKSTVDDSSNDQVLNSVKSEAYKQESEQDYSDNFIAEAIQNSENRISAHIHDKTIGTIQHPVEENKQISYNNDKSYIVYAHLNSNGEKLNLNRKDNIEDIGNLYSIQKLPFNSDLSKFLTLQLLPSIGYKLENGNEQNKILNGFEVDEFGTPKQMNSAVEQNTNQRLVSTAEVDYIVDHPKTVTETQHVNNINTLYDGPSSYYAPQLSVGSLDVTQSTLTDSDKNSKIEDLSDSENVSGYGKVRPLKRFLF